MGTLSGDDVLGAAARWVWVPEDVRDLRTADYRLTHYGSHSSVQWSRTTRPLDEVVAEVVDLAREAGAARLRWWVTATTEPADTEQRLGAHGFTLVETVDLLARPLDSSADAPPPPPPPPPGVQVVDVRDRSTLAAAARLGSQVFDWDEPTDAQLDEELRAITSGDGRRWTMRRYLALVDGTPAATAGATVDGDALRLWGGSTLPAMRGRGAYRALVARRLADAASTTARFALVKAVDATSSPILRRLGFAAYGEERCWQLPLS